MFDTCSQRKRRIRVGSIAIEFDPHATNRSSRLLKFLDTCAPNNTSETSWLNLEIAIEFGIHSTNRSSSLLKLLEKFAIQYSTVQYTTVQ